MVYLKTLNERDCSQALVFYLASESVANHFIKRIAVGFIDKQIEVPINGPLDLGREFPERPSILPVLEQIHIAELLAAHYSLENTDQRERLISRAPGEIEL
ncbi:hypothetical protein [Oligoflexus sp.]|uniref:hypothetical protein n=1 Tax=Oligoflexus sp. TaxID=1971216 RepID=UPI002D78F887|nr:hypothetical protein [Oligoflexus sp.]